MVTRAGDELSFFPHGARHLFGRLFLGISYRFLFLVFYCLVLFFLFFNSVPEFHNSKIYLKSSFCSRHNQGNFLYIELQNIYKEMDAEGKETMISAVDRLPYVQRTYALAREFWDFFNGG